MQSLLFRTALAGLAGIAAWAIWEPSAPKDIGALEQWQSWSAKLTVTIGAMVGLTIGWINGYLQGSRAHALRGALLGLILSGVGGAVGMTAGSRMVEMLFGSRVFNDQAMVGFQMIARAMVITPIGAAIGLGIGASTLSGQRALYGLIGGALGGLTAGLLFDPVGSIFGVLVLLLRGTRPGEIAEVGIVSRALLGLLLGLAISLFIGWVEQVARTAWVRLVLGRNEGREWPIYWPQTLIGRSETAQIPIFGDPAVAPAHATIVRQGGGYLLADAGSGAATLLEGVPIAGATPLHHGARIQVGQSLLEFQLRGGQPFPGAAQLVPGVSAPEPQASPAHAGVQTAPYPGPAQAVPGVQARLGLVALDGPLAGRRFEVNGQLELGRESASVPLAYDSSASRRHALIAQSPTGLVLTDLGSTNGTFVNGQKVQSSAVKPGDLVRIGITTFRVE